MSIEKPMSESSEGVPSGAEEVETPAPNGEKSDKERRAETERQCLEWFIEDFVVSSNLEPEERVFVTRYIQTHHGAWIQYDGRDVRVEDDDVWIKDNTLMVIFTVFDEGKKIHDIEVKIPLSE